jgi:hypothetical protein
MPNSDWRILEELESSLRRGEPLRLDAKLAAVLQVLSDELGIPLGAGQPGAEEFVLGARMQIRDGSRRLMRLSAEVDELVEVGRKDEARALIERVAEEETIPLYIEQARRFLRRLE